MRVAVTGAAGHIGGNLVRALLAHGRKVRVLVRRDRRAVADLDVEVIEADVLDPSALERAFEDVEVVFHLAALISISGDQKGRVTHTNVDGVRHVAEAALAQGVQRLVHFSSMHAFDLDYDRGPIDEGAPRPGPSHPAYDRAKAAGESALREVIARGLDAVIVNPTAVIGPVDFKPSRMGRLFLALHRGAMPCLIDGGCNWVDVRDVAASAIAAAEKGRSGENYLLGGSYHSVRELAALVHDVTGRPVPSLTAPMWLARLGAPVAQLAAQLRGREPLFTSDAMHALRGNPDLSSAKAVRELGHAPRPIRDSVRDIYAWFEERGMLKPAPR